MDEIETDLMCNDPMCSLNLNPHALCMCADLYGEIKTPPKWQAQEWHLANAAWALSKQMQKSQLVTSRCDRVRCEVWAVLVCCVLGSLCVWYFQPASCVRQHVLTVSACSDYWGTVSVSDETMHSQERATHYILLRRETERKYKKRHTHISEALLYGERKTPPKWRTQKWHLSNAT